jgi:hypothetical protein
MSLPGFTAEATVSRLGTIHRARGSRRPRGAAFLAAPIGGGSALLRCLAECQNECLDHAGFSTSKCSRICHKTCRDSGSGGPPTRPNPINCALSKGGCYAWFAACTINPFGFGCKFVLDQCLQDSGC